MKAKIITDYEEISFKQGQLVKSKKAKADKILLVTKQRGTRLSAVVIVNSQNSLNEPVGSYSEDYLTDCFEPFKGTIELVE